MTTLPTDLEIQQHLAPVRIAVLEATRTVRSPRRSTRFRVTRNIIIAAAAAAALTGGALAVSQALQGHIDHSATCFEHASLESHQQGVGGAGATSDDPIDPILNCEYIWSEGYFEPGGYDSDSSHDFPVPPDLTACTLPDGTAGVFPREGRPEHDFCAALGLADWDSD